MPAERLKTRKVKVGNIYIGGDAHLVPQTMTTTDTMDTQATVIQTIECAEAGAELVRITAPSKKEALNLAEIKAVLLEKGVDTPLVADIHYTPNAAEIAAKYVEKVRVNPGNYVDKKKFEYIEYTDESYQQEIQKIREKLVPLIDVCKQHQTALRIGTNHGSLSDRIMSRYGDTAEGMVESAMEFLRIARDEDFHEIVLSMKSSNPIVMVEAYRKLVAQMMTEFGELYPLHLGVTEAGDGEDGRVKSALGIGTLLEDGIGDTIRVSLTEDPQFEIPVCQAFIEKYQADDGKKPDYLSKSYLHVERRQSRQIADVGGDRPSVVLCRLPELTDLVQLEEFGYRYDRLLDKWHRMDIAADILVVEGRMDIDKFPEDLHIAVSRTEDPSGRFWGVHSLTDAGMTSTHRALVETDLKTFLAVAQKKNISNQISDMSVLLIDRAGSELEEVRELKALLAAQNIKNPIIWESHTENHGDRAIIDLTTDLGSPFIEGIGDGLSIRSDEMSTMLPLAFSILQATRTRISKAEYISCPSCGRTLFDLQETTAMIRTATSHLKGVKIAIMGCIVNGPGEMADADFGYVGAGVDKISLYKGQELVRRNIPSAQAVDELIELLKENEAWQEP